MINKTLIQGCQAVFWVAEVVVGEQSSDVENFVVADQELVALRYFEMRLKLGEDVGESQISRRGRTRLAWELMTKPKID